MALTIFAASVISMVLVYTVLGSVDHLVYIWPLTGVQLALLLPEWKTCAIRRRCQIAGALGVFVGGSIMGLPSWFAAIVAVTSGIEVWITGSILQNGIESFEDLKQRKNLLLFVVAAIIGPITAGLLGGLPLALFLHDFYIRSAIILALSDSLGMGIVLPTLLFAFTGEYRSLRKLAPLRNKIVPALVFFIAVAFFVFHQTNGPLLFLIFPPIMLVVFAMGLEGAVFSSIVLSLIACYETAHGHGPLWLAKSANPKEQLLLLQLFLWMAVATALPIGALLDERNRSAKAADNAQSIYQILLKNAEDMIILSSIDGSQRFVSAACEKLTGWTPEEYLTLDRMSLSHPDDREMANLVIESMLQGKSEHTFRYRLAQKNSGWRWVEATAKTYLDEATGEIAGYVATVRDIEEFKNTEELWKLERETLTELALTDSLTGLFNRRAFGEALHSNIRRMGRDGSKIVLMMVDVDHFKTYNDIYGHQAGDECLRQIAEALRSQVSRADDIIARWGGEEFVVLLFGTDLAGSRYLAKRMLDAVRALNIEHAEHPKKIVTVSIGIAEADAESTIDPSLWIQRADRALYRSKHAGRDRFTVDGAEPVLVGNSHGLEAG